MRILFIYLTNSMMQVEEVTDTPVPQRSISILSSHLHLGCFPLDFATRSFSALLIVPMHTECSAHLILHD
jgi:hypothetical protein